MGIKATLVPPLYVNHTPQKKQNKKKGYADHADHVSKCHPKFPSWRSVKIQGYGGYVWIKVDLLLATLYL